MPWQGITWQISVNLVDMLKSKMNFESNSFDTGYICIEINPQPKKIQIRLVWNLLTLNSFKSMDVNDFNLTLHT